MHTYTAAARKYDDKCLEPACSTNHPNKTNEQYHAEDVLNTWEVDAEHCAEFLTTEQHTMFSTQIYQPLQVHMADLVMCCTYCRLLTPHATICLLLIQAYT